MQTIIITAVIAIAIILYGLYRLKKLRKLFEAEKQKSDSQLLPSEALYKNQQLLTLFKKSQDKVRISMWASAVIVVIVGFAFYWYDTHKETWAKQAEQNRIEKVEREKQETINAEQKRLTKAERAKKKEDAKKQEEEQEFQAWKAEKIAKAQKEADKAFASYQEALESIKQHQNLQDQAKLVSDSLSLTKEQKTKALKLQEKIQQDFKNSYTKSMDCQSLVVQYQKQMKELSAQILNLDNQEKRLSEKIKDIKWEIKTSISDNIEQYEKEWKDATLAIAEAQNLTIDDKNAADEREIVFIVFLSIFGIMLAFCIVSLIYTAYY